LADVGFLEGRDVTIDYRAADGHLERYPAIAADLVRQRPAAIIALSGIAALAAKAATRDIPIIFGTGDDPVEAGLVASLNRPGGNVTGVMLIGAESAEKRLQLLHEAVPAAGTIALLVGAADVPGNQVETRHMQSAAATLGLRLLVFNVATAFQSRETFGTEIAQVFATLVEQRAGAVVMGVSMEIFFRSREILSLAARFALPTMGSYGVQAPAGGLLTLTVSDSDFDQLIRQQGVYAGRILKGEKPGDLPVIQLTKFKFIINLKTAKALGLTIPTNLLVLADEVIEE
jgi:putative tryptophan/tyrosine transport system substrate-binding protein